MKKRICINELQEKEKIINDLLYNYGERVYLVSTVEMKKNKSAWANMVVQKMYSINRLDMKNYAYHFSYIKFAKNTNGKILGIVGGKSQFHYKNRSDVCFYDIYESKKKVAIFMKEKHLRWYEDEIIILANDNNCSSKEAFANEKILQNNYYLFG